MRLTLVVKFLFGSLLLLLSGAGCCYILLVYSTNEHLIIFAGIFALLILFCSAFYFASMAQEHNYTVLKSLEEEHAKEREKIRVNAERQKVRLVNKNQKQLLQESRRVHGLANLKTGAVLTGFLGLAALMLYSQFMAMGLLVLSMSVGGGVGYFARVKQEKIGLKRAGKELLSSGASIEQSRKKIS